MLNFLIYRNVQVLLQMTKNDLNMCSTKIIQNIGLTKIWLLILLFLVVSSVQSQTDEFSGPGNYEILKKDGPIVIPFKFKDGKPVMKVKINGKKAHLMIDNGILWDEVWLFGSSLVEELNFLPEESGAIGGAGEGDPTAAYYAENISIKFKDIIFNEQPLIVSPPEAGFADIFSKADGQLCNTFFKHFVVEFDFEKNKVILHKPGEFVPYENGSVLTMVLNETDTHAIPMSFTTLDGKEYSGNTDIDFGGIYLFKVALNNQYQIEVPKNSEPIAAYGAQGKIDGYIGEIKNLSIGKFQFDNPKVAFGDKSTAYVHPDNLGVIGLPLFMKFNIAFDYLNMVIYIEPNKTFDGKVIE